MWVPREHISTACLGRLHLSELTDLEADKKRGVEQLESFAHTYAPSMTIFALSEVNAQIYVIFIA